MNTTRLGYGLLAPALMVASSLMAADTADITILTYPIGLVAGEVPIDVDLGATGEPAELYLDGVHTCSLTATDTRCTVDLGSAPHVHLLELFRFGSDGEVVARAVRWLNRPGQEAELGLQMQPRDAQGICRGQALWAHPMKKDPVVLEITENGKSLLIGGDGRSFAFPCPNPEDPHVVAASAIFPDGRRAEAVTLSGGFGGRAEAGLTAVALAAVAADRDPCAVIAEGAVDGATPAQRSGFEVVIVLDPSAGYRTLMASGWTKGMMPTTTSSTKQFDSLVQRGSKGSEAMPKNSWKRADSTFIDADKLWFVLPDDVLGRANGFANGKMNWLPTMFHFGSVKLKEDPRLADAVAASGLVAAAGPLRRAVVLILGNNADRDRSGFTAEQARAYLAEVGVPLYVLRNGKLREDGWSAGVPVRSMEAVADAFEAIKADLQSQCVAWFPGDMHPNTIAAALPEGIEIAGRQGEVPTDVAAVWQQAELATASVEPASDGAPVMRERVEVTAVTVLFIARDADGQPIVDLKPNEVEVAEDGLPVAVLEVAPYFADRRSTATSSVEESAAVESRPQQAEAQAIPVAVYVDRGLSSSAEISSALKALADRSEWMTSLGPVDVVVADRDVTTVLEGARDPGAVRDALGELAAQPAGRHAIESIRTRFIRDIRKIPNRLTPDSPEEDEPGLIARLQAGEEPKELERSTVLTAARSAIFEEDSVLRHAMVRANDWALTSPFQGPKLLLVVGAGFDEDPVDFYLPFVERVETQHAASAREEFKRYRQAERVDRLGSQLAAAGWLVTPVATRTLGSHAVSADSGGGDRFQAFLSAQPDAIRTESSNFLLLDPIGSQRHLAAPSGGDVAMGADGLDRLIEQSAGWYRLSYQVDRAPDGEDHGLSIMTTRPGATVRSPSVVSSETLEGEAAARVRRIFRGSEDRGDLGVEIAMEPSRRDEDGTSLSAEATITVRLDAIAPLLVDGGRRALRVSVGVRSGQDDPFILHRTETVDGVVPAWGYSVPLRWPIGEATLVVVVEDLGSGSWGAATSPLE